MPNPLAESRRAAKIVACTKPIGASRTTIQFSQI